MAGDHDRDRVAVVRQADGTGQTGIAEHRRLLAVAAGLAVGDLPERLPGALLEVGAPQRQPEIERAPLACEVLAELLLDRFEPGRGARDLLDRLRHAVPREEQRTQAAIIGERDQLTQGRVEVMAAHADIVAAATDTRRGRATATGYPWTSPAAHGILERMADIWNLPQDALWDADAAASYDTPGRGMFAPEVLEPTVARLAALAGGGRALELAIGTGRVAIPLHEAGIAVVGIEQSEAMIAALRRKVGEDELPVIHGSMVGARADGEFDLVYLVYNSISNLYTQQEQIDCVRNAASHLRPGGRFVVELWVPQPQPVGTSHAQVFGVADGYLGVDVLDLGSQRGVSHHVRFQPDGSASVGFSPFRYIWPAELDVMATLAGLELDSRFADWAGSPFTGESRSHVSVYRRRPEPDEAGSS